MLLGLADIGGEGLAALLGEHCAGCADGQAGKGNEIEGPAPPSHHNDEDEEQGSEWEHHHNEMDYQWMHGQAGHGDEGALGYKGRCGNRAHSGNLQGFEA
ncbi:unannotated protein [freshwater metagenome]|uniref:Unannotated protein n=1 Tax=freshwater metagenome TaxID=449393 RepID=A0A6J7N7G9_9ZZZZ